MRRFLPVLVIMVCSIAISGQTNRGGISGTVTDQNGAVVDKYEYEIDFDDPRPQVRLSRMMHVNRNGCTHVLTEVNALCPFISH